MNDYSCYYWVKNKKGEFIECINSACWAGIDDSNVKRYFQNHYIKDIKDINRIYILSKDSNNDIIERAEIICPIINKITGCKLFYSKKKNQYYIIYDLFTKYYRKNLVLLNFIRHCWYDSKVCDVHVFWEYIKSYQNKYDPLEHLMEAAKNSYMNPNNSYFEYDHSCIGKDIIPKTVKELYLANLDCSFLGMQHFMKEKKLINEGDNGITKTKNKINKKKSKFFNPIFST